MRMLAYCLTACLTTTGSLLAHPGHGVTAGDSAAHYLLELEHIGPVVILAVACIVTGLWLKRRKDGLRREYARKR